MTWGYCLYILCPPYRISCEILLQIRTHHDRCDFVVGGVKRKKCTRHIWSCLVPLKTSRKGYFVIKPWRGNTALTDLLMRRQILFTICAQTELISVLNRLAKKEKTNKQTNKPIVFFFPFFFTPRVIETSFFFFFFFELHVCQGQ